MAHMFEQAITPENYRSLCYTNRELIKGPVKGIVTDFHGFGCSSMKDKHNEADIMYAEKGILSIYPFYNPWAWANDTCRIFIDRLIDILFEVENLPDDAPIVLTGESMGGLTSLVYARYAKRKPVACVANCPVCDLPLINKARVDVFRALIEVLGHYDCSFEEAVRSVSPLHLIGDMPYIPYYIVQATEDDDVNIHQHAEVYVAAMRAAGHDVTYVIAEGLRHCEMNVALYEKYYGFITGFFKD